MKKCFIAALIGFISFVNIGSISVIYAGDRADLAAAEEKQSDNAKKLKMPSTDGYDALIKDNGISRVIGDKGIKDGVGNLLAPENKELIKKINYVIAAIALIWIAVLGGKFTLSRGDEEKLSQYKMQFGWIILGLFIVSVAEYAGYKAFSPIASEGLENVTAFVAISKKIIIFIQYLVGGVALLAGIRSGLALIIHGDEDEVVQKEKEFIKIFLFSLGLVFFAEAIETWIDLSNTTGQGINGEQITKEIVGLINFILMFLSASALFMVVLSSFYYVVSLGDDDVTSRAKKMIINSIIALIIVFSSYTIVGFLVQ